ncbi:MAG TPA: DUF167 domain-containing protein [Candidatus Paceibacterota bacterium]
MFLKVKVFPESKRDEIKPVKQDKWEVYVRARAVNNEANQRVLELVREKFPKVREIKIIKGHKRPNKTIEIVPDIDSLI